MSEVEILDATSNAVVARYIDREFPGILLQGDTLKIIFDDLVELKEEIAAKDFDAVEELAESLKNQFSDLLEHYEMVLKRHGLQLPYIDS